MNVAGAGLAADKAVRVKAAAQLLNDGDGRSGSQVNLQINNGGPALAPGIVIRLPASAGISPLELTSHKVGTNSGKDDKPNVKNLDQAMEH